MTDQSSGEPPEEPPRPEHRLERVERVRGRLPGDARVRIVRSGDLRRKRGYVEATDKSFEAEGTVGQAIDRVRVVLFGRRLSSEQEHEERLSKVTGLALVIASTPPATETETVRM